MRNLRRGRVGCRDRAGQNLVRWVVEHLESRVLLAAVNWTGGGDGVQWTDARNWSSNPSLPAAGDDVTINAAGNPTITLSSGTQSINSLTTGDPLNVSGGTLQVANTIQLSANLTLSSSGTIQGGTITGSGGAQLIARGGTLDGLTLGCNLTIPSSANVNVKDGLTLNSSTVTLANTNGFVNLYFVGSQTLGGTGQVIFGGSNTTDQIYVQGGNTAASAATLTVGPNISVTLQGASETGRMDGFYTQDSLINQGTINAAVSNQTLTLNFGSPGTLTNTGTLEATNNGTLNIGGVVSAATLGTFNATGGTVAVTGTLNNSGNTLALTASTGSLTLVNSGTIQGGTINGSGGAQLIARGGTLDGLTLGCNLTIPSSANVNVKDGLTLNSSTVTLANTNGFVNLYFVGSQTLGGTGQVIFGGSNTTDQIYVQGGNTAASAATLTVGPNISISAGASESGRIDGFYTQDSLINQGTINASAASQTITLNFGSPGTLNNTGTLEATNGGTLNVAGFSILGGNVAADASSHILLNGSVSIPIGATLTVSGTTTASQAFNTQGALNITTGSVSLNGGGTQSGSLSISSGATLSFGGSSAQNLTNTCSVSGAGGVTFVSTSSSTVSGTYNVASTLVQDQAQVNFANSAALGNLSVSGGTLTIGLAGGGGISPATTTTNLVTVSQESLSGGTLNVLAGWTLDDTGPLLFAGPATVGIGSGNSTPGILMLGADVTFSGASGTASIQSTGTGSKLGVVDLGGGTRSFTVNDGSASVDLSISANLTDGALRMAGGGWMQLINSSNYAGGTTLAGGTLEADSSSAFGGGAVTFSGGGMALRGVTSIPNTFAASPSSSISLDVGSGTVQIPGTSLGTALNVTGNGGTLVINGSVTLQANLTINNSANLEITGAIGGQGSITKTLGGILTFDGASPNNYNGQTSVNAGTVVLNKPANVVAVPAGGLSINGPSTIQLNASGQITPTTTLTLNSVPGLAVFNLNGQSQSLAGLSITGGGSILLGGGTLNIASPLSVPSGTLSIGSGGTLQLGQVSIGATGMLSLPKSSGVTSYTFTGLAITAGGKFDLSNNTLMINYAGQTDPIATIRSYLSGGFNNGAWTGSGINSSAASTNAAHTTAIGYADSADGLIAAQPANTIELKYTLYGDTTLTASVGFNDFTRLTQHYNQTSGGAWDTGDFNYDGSVNSADFTLMTRTYNTSLGTQASPIATPAASAASSGASDSAGAPKKIPALPVVRVIPTRESAQHKATAKHHKPRDR